jgi:hypothetical protein
VVHIPKKEQSGNRYSFKRLRQADREDVFLTLSFIIQQDTDLTNNEQIKAIQWPNKNRQYNGQTRTDNTMAKRKMTKGQTMVYKTLHKKLMIEQHDPHKGQRVNSGAP